MADTSVSNVVISTDTFDGWVTKHNLITDLIHTKVVTAETNSTGAVTTGNVVVNGIFSANTIVVNGNTSLRGGTISTPDTLFISSNVDVGNNSLLVGDPALRVLTVNSTVITLAANGLVVNSSGFFINADFSVTGNLITGDISTTGNLAISGTTNVVDIEVSGTANIATLEITSLSLAGNITLDTPQSIAITNSTVNNVITATRIAISNSSTSANLDSAKLVIGTSTVNASLQSTLVQVINSSSTANLDPIKLAIGISTLNSIAVSVGANAVVNSSTIVIGNTTINSTAISIGNTTVNASITSSSFNLNGSSMPAAVVYVIDGGGVVLSTGVKGDLSIPFDCQIKEVTLLADQSGNVVVDIWKNTFANYPPTVSNTITASAIPTLSSNNRYDDSVLTGWTNSISSGDTLRFNVNSVDVVTRVTLTLKVVRI